MNQSNDAKEEEKSLTPKEAIFIARKYGLEAEIRQELASGKTPEEALEEWNI